MQLSGGVGGQIKREVGTRRTQGDQARAEQQSFLLRREYFTDGRTGVCRMDEFWSLVDFAPDIHADWPNQEAENKGHAPTPAMQLMRRKRAGQHKAEKCREQLGYLLTGHLPTGVKAFAMGCVLNHKSRRAAELSSDR